MIKYCLHYISSQQYTKVKVVQSNVQVLQFRDFFSIFAIWNWLKKIAASITACINNSFHLVLFAFSFTCLHVLPWKWHCFVNLLFVGISPAILSDFAKCWYIIKYLHLYSSYNELPFMHTGTFIHRNINKYPLGTIHAKWEITKKHQIYLIKKYQ